MTTNTARILNKVANAADAFVEHGLAACIGALTLIAVLGRAFT
jgi:hypothetical protein